MVLLLVRIPERLLLLPIRDIAESLTATLLHVLWLAIKAITAAVLKHTDS
jgi:hypothetical protein